MDTVESLIQRLLVFPKLTEELEEAVPTRGRSSKMKLISQVSIEKKIDEAPRVVRDMYSGLEQHLKSLGDDVKVYKQKHYVSFRRKRNFASVLVYNRKKQIRVYLNVDPGDVDLTRTGLRDVRQVGHYGTGDLEVTISSKTELDSFSDLFRESYSNS